MVEEIRNTGELGLLCLVKLAVLDGEGGRTVSYSAAIS
jgi:ribosomal protein S28E/S33